MDCKFGWFFLNDLTEVHVRKLVINPSSKMCNNLECIHVVNMANALMVKCKFCGPNFMREIMTNPDTFVCIHFISKCTLNWNKICQPRAAWSSGYMYMHLTWAQKGHVLWRISDDPSTYLYKWKGDFTSQINRSPLVPVNPTDNASKGRNFHP